MMDDGLLSSAITTGLGTRLIGRKVIYYPSLESTMAAARREARRGVEAGTVIIAGEQTVGRGRRQRNWLSPPGSVALSIILHPRIAYLPFLVMLASLAVVDSIEAITGLKAQLKWPNDVLIDGRKVCGILVESELKGKQVEYAVIGIGLNANFRLADFPDIPPAATSLADELGREVPYLELVRRLLVEADRLYSALPSAGAIYEQWRDRLVTLGREVVVEGDSVRNTGIAESVAGDGSLLLRCPDGSLVRVVVGDVTLRDYGQEQLQDPPPGRP